MYMLIIELEDTYIVLSKVTCFLEKNLDDNHIVVTSLFYFIFGLILYIPVNSYGHVRTVSSPNHIFSWQAGLRG